MRIDKYLSQSTGFSRKDIKRMMHKDRVEVNGKPLRDSSYKLSEDDVVTLDDREISAPKPRYFMLYKPQGYVCSSDDGTHPTINGLLIDEVRPEELHLAGRLDVDTTGLVLITDDGQWSHKITSPRHQCSKRYHVVTADPISEEAIDTFATGILLQGEKEPTKPAALEILASHEAYLTLTEGRYHQVKRMFAAIGNRVVELHRDRIGRIDLDEELLPGEYRPLTQEEIERVVA